MKDNSVPLYTSPQLGQTVTNYAEQHSTALPKYITDYHADISSNRDDSNYMSSVFQSQYNTFLVKSTGAKRVLEIGVYVGFSALVWADAVGPDGLVTGLEYESEYAELSKKVFEANSVKNVEIIVGSASESYVASKTYFIPHILMYFTSLPKLNPSEPYDLVFIDADKTGYPGYLKQLLELSKSGSSNRLLRPGALIVSDNVLRRGLVADDKALGGDELPEDQQDSVLAIREFNDMALQSPRLETFVLPLWDGVNISRLVD
jgi:predicted O-methyltransferase YrrM